MSIFVYPKPPYNFPLTMHYVKRSDLEIVDRVHNGIFQTLTEIGGRLFLITVKDAGSVQQPCLEMDIESSDQSPVDNAAVQSVQSYLQTRFHLQDDAAEFYRHMEKEAQLQPLLRQFYGLKPVQASSLFEALSWAMIGQQINIRFAYSLKKTLVELAGARMEKDGETYYAFPNVEAIAALEYEDLTRQRFSRRKAEYLIDFARAVSCGEVYLELTPTDDPEKVITYLTTIRGIGRWTAEYGLMRGLGYADALPAADIGLRNAVRDVYQLSTQPDEETVRAIGTAWLGWRSWVSFYLWFSLAYHRVQPDHDDKG